MYCEKCHVITENVFCPDCGSKHLRQPEISDQCLLTVMDSMFGEVLADILREHKVPFERKTARKVGLGALMGSLFERYYFYVPYPHFEEASDLLTAFFENNGNIEILGFEEVNEAEHISTEPEDEIE
ncbi:MAG: hypothetical protein E7331_04785 [Clostridiales bacterium]|nr:hypothetical protein [Clostridiales bacterium]